MDSTQNYWSFTRCGAHSNSHCLIEAVVKRVDARILALGRNWPLVLAALAGVYVFGKSNTSFSSEVKCRLKRFMKCRNGLIAYAQSGRPQSKPFSASL